MKKKTIIMLIVVAVLVILSVLYFKLSHTYSLPNAATTPAVAPAQGNHMPIVFTPVWVSLTSVICVVGGLVVGWIARILYAKYIK